MNTKWVVNLAAICQNARSVLAVGLGLLVASPSFAETSVADHLWPDLTIRAFGTLGMARSSSDTAEYVRDLSQPSGLTRQWSGKIDSVLGVQANLALSDSTEAVIQALSRYRYDGSYDPEIAWAFISHEFSPDLKLRVGRLGTEFYMLSDSRLIGYSNLTVRPSPDFFAPLVFSYHDGFDVSGSVPVMSGLLRGKFFLGRSPETSPFYGDITWNLKGTRLMGGYLDYFEGPWQVRIGQTHVRFSKHEIPLDALANPVPVLSLAPELSTVGTTARFSSAGVIYDQGALRLQGMYGRIQHETKSYDDSWSAFGLASYRIGSVTPYVGYATVKSSRRSLEQPLPPILGLDALIDGIRSIPHMDHHTVTLGARWDFHSNMALKAQLDLLRGSPDSRLQFRGTNGAWEGDMRVMSIALDFAF